jgi:phage terminase small subunit
MADINMTEKQKMFIKEYLKDLNATQAAIRAGYSEDSAKVIGCENLTKPYIAEEIEKELSARTKKVEIDAEYVLNNLKKVAETSMERNDSAGANKSLELLGKYLKLFTDKTETSVKFDKSPVNELIASIEELKDEDK